ncbi:MAG: hypothetical protein IKP31_00935 [Lachnospiraceae bacterium]|nr:hypothetical protein [Lachnospiraceae bacterium]
MSGKKRICRSAVTVITIALLVIFQAIIIGCDSIAVDTRKIDVPTTENISKEPALRFRNSKLLNEHYEKHGIDMGFKSAKEYEEAAAAVPLDPNALHKTEAEDGDDVYYIQATNEFVIVSTDGYIRTYFCPDSGIKYYNKQ